MFGKEPIRSFKNRFNNRNSDQNDDERDSNRGPRRENRGPRRDGDFKPRNRGRYHDRGEGRDDSIDGDRGFRRNNRGGRRDYRRNSRDQNDNRGGYRRDDRGDRRYPKKPFQRRDGDRRSFRKGSPIYDRDPTDSYPPAIKEQLLNYIYSTVEISKFKYKLLEYEHDLPSLWDKRYFVSPNYNGINGLMVFTKIRDRFYSFIVDRRTLSYKMSQVDLEKVKMIPINIRLNKEIYNGTIIDGVLLYNHKNNNTKTFVINDIYSFCGQDLLKDFMNHKIMNINAFMDTCYVEDSHLNSINFFINKLYKLHEVKDLVNSYIPKSKYSNSIKGLAFYPEISGTKLIYLYNNCSNSKVGEASPQAVQLMTPIKVRDSKIKVEDSFTAVFRMKKSETVDVYQLYLTKKVYKDGKKFMKFKKFDLAYLPTKDTSYFCKDLFSKTDSDTVLVECKYMPDRNKWIPVSTTTKKKPDDLDKIREKLGIAEEDGDGE